MIAMLWIKAVINMAIEVVRAVKPWAGSDEDASGEPLGSVVPIWSAVVRRVVEVAVWANWRNSNIDRDLGRCRAWNA
jgi:hypothetical protein